MWRVAPALRARDVGATLRARHARGTHAATAAAAADAGTASKADDRRARIKKLLDELTPEEKEVVCKCLSTKCAGVHRST